MDENIDFRTHSESISTLFRFFFFRTKFTHARERDFEPIYTHMKNFDDDARDVRSAETDDGTRAHHHALPFFFLCFFNFVVVVVVVARPVMNARERDRENCPSEYVLLLAETRDTTHT